MLSAFRSLPLAGLLFSALTAITAHAANVTGTVTNQTTGDPISGARVIIGTFTGNGKADTTTTDAKGAYAFDSVSVGFHTVVASHDGYTPKTANVNVTNANGTSTANITLAPTSGGGQTGTITGTVKDQATSEAIKGATVILSHPAGRGGPTPIDTVLTDGEGRFTFSAVPAANNYIVTASATGYNNASNENVDVANGASVAVPLTLVKLPKPNSAIFGKLSDAASKAGIANAMVVRRRRAAGSAVWTALDSTLTDAGGNFAFTGIEASTAASPYSLLGRFDGYITGTSANIVVAANENATANLALTKIAMGSMLVFVGRDTTGNPALAGAEVAASLDGQTTLYTGTTDAKGWVSFPSVVAGTYSVSANLTGFVSKIVSRTVTADEKDTGYVYLARATTQNSKSLSGLIRDAEGKAIAGAKVIFEANSANGITLTATSTATGDYGFNGIPANTTGGTVTVSKDGFATYTGTVTLGGQASFLNVTLKVPVGVLSAGRAAPQLHLVISGRGLTAEFAPSASAGTLSVYDARGSLEQSLAVPAGNRHSGIRLLSAGPHYLVLSQGALRQRLTVPVQP